MSLATLERPPAVRSRSRLPAGAAFALQASIVLFLLAGSAAPTPLYALYQQEWGFRPITVTVVFGVYALVEKEPLTLCLAAFIYVSCKQQWLLLESGREESLFGYDFSQGYTSLERDQPPPAPRRRRPNFFQRWLQRRAARKLQLEQERQLAEEQRMDELLEKIARQGKQSLTDEEQRFLVAFTRLGNLTN